MLLSVDKNLPSVDSANAIQITISLSILVHLTTSSQNAKLLYVHTAYELRNVCALASTVSHLINAKFDTSMGLIIWSLK